jgi:GNAT superfamily N-acetyltransferase
MIEIKQLAPDEADWQSLVDCLRVGGDAHWVLDEYGQPKTDDLVFLAGLVDGQVVGQLVLRRQPIMIPATEWAAERDRLLRDPDGEPLYETLVQTFRVVEAHRRQGVGRAMQLRALDLTKALGCIQMRSWSSLDKPANYHLKLSLGFGFHPEVQETPSSLKVSGGYFVKRV